MPWHDMSFANAAQLSQTIYDLSDWLEEEWMRILKSLGFSALAVAMLSGSSGAPAQVAISIGAPPVCPYGYFDYAPYDCAPYGYYGPDWFVGGLFIGAGPWFHGPEHFSGSVDYNYHPEHGYHGSYPARGEKPREGWNGHAENFHATAHHDGHGHEVK
jgi:hypothetical protein